jgi:cardiolipin synthase A/B
MLTWIYLVLKFFFVLYAVWTVIFIIMDEREPSSALAWILFVNIAPLLGMVVYLLFGRSTRPRSGHQGRSLDRERQLLGRRLDKMTSAQGQLIDQVAARLTTPAHKRLLRFAANADESALTTGNTVRILQNGIVKIPQLLSDLAAAKQSIHMHYYMWASDELGEQLYQVLSERVKAGVQVRVLFDSVGSLGRVSFGYRRRMRQAGIAFHPSISLSSPRDILSLNYRNHTKIVVIDGRVGYTGGMNMTQEYVTGGRRFASWRDTAVRLEGDSAGVLQGIFALAWLESRGEQLDAKYFPTQLHEDNGRGIPVQVVYSSSRARREAIKTMYQEMITTAQDHIYIQTPYFIPDAGLLMALSNAAQAGVDVRLMITGVPDKRSVLAAGFSYLHTVMRSGVRVYLYQAGFLHSKTISIDASIVSIGSTNFDIRSFRLSDECNALIYDTGIAKEYEADYQADMENCEEFTVAKWQALSFPTRLYMAVCRLASPIL